MPENLLLYSEGYLYQWLKVFIPDDVWAQLLAAFVLLLVVVVLIAWVANNVVVAVMRRLLTALDREDWFVALSRRRIFRRLTELVIVLVIGANLALLPLSGSFVSGLQRLLYAVALVLFFAAINGLLKAVQDTYAASTRAQTRSIKGYIELGKIISWGICTILVFSLLIDRSPLIMLSGLGALSAVLLLVFKDTLLSLVASTQMTTNDMLRIGDWIEMPQSLADGYVIDIALHTVKVENWDKTVTTVPTYKLFSESYRNYRHMFETGGRRIKRTLRIDAASVRFLSEEELQQLSRYRLLANYLSEKAIEIDEANRRLGEWGSHPANRRRLTNLGTFRAYAMAYLRENNELRQDMIMLVRMMQPDSEGIPVEIYCFSAITAWAEYERIQGGVFDHLIAMLPELSLRLFQRPSGRDISAGIRAARLPTAPKPTGPSSESAHT